MASLREYVIEHAQRGPCQCGKCIDAPVDPELHQPAGHTADVVFFQVAAKGDPSAEDLRNLAFDQFPLWFDGHHHSYIEIGADLGDQGVALMLMGLGTILGIWRLLTPKTMLGLDGDSAMRMAGAGFVSIQATKAAA